MPENSNMTSRELGLLLAQQLLDVEDLHYGLWDPDLELSLGNIARAQQRYTDLLLEKIEACLPGSVDPAGRRILDVGCGTGHMLQQLLACGYPVDAVNPSPWLNTLVRERLAHMQDTATTLYETGFESLPLKQCGNRYDLLLFSESFQYIPLPVIFEMAPQLLRNSGRLLICDFFKTAAHRDGGSGDRSFSGGHILAEFYRCVEQSPFRISYDEDLTARVSPNIALLEEWLTQRLAPALSSVDSYLLATRPWLTRWVKWLGRHKLARARYKYLSGHRSQAVFEKYKSYRLLILDLD